MWRTIGSFEGALSSFRARHKLPADLRAMIGVVEKEDPMEFTKFVVGEIQNKRLSLKDALVKRMVGFGGIEVAKQLKPFHKALILWAATEAREASWIQKLCLSGPAFPLIYDFGQPSGAPHQIEDIYEARSIPELFKIVLDVDGEMTMASRIFGVVGDTQPRMNLMRKLREELNLSTNAQYLRQLSPLLT